MEWLNAPIVLFLLAGVGYLYRQEHERRTAAERQLSDRKYQAYIVLLDIFFDIMKLSDTGKSMAPTEVRRRMMDAHRDLLIYGSDDVVKAYQRLHATVPDKMLTVLSNWAETIIAIRRDMGNASTTIKSDDVLRFFIRDYDEAKAREQGRLAPTVVQAEATNMDESGRPPVSPTLSTPPRAPDKGQDKTQ